MLEVTRNAHTDFYPRSPCGERPPRGGICYLDNIISIHALLAESDAVQIIVVIMHTLFLSTLSLRRATIALFDFPIVPAISIHALLAESDQHENADGMCQYQFLSTLSLRRATTLILHMAHLKGHFYPRSPCGERLSAGREYDTEENFYPRSPCGERLPCQSPEKSGK